jgi:hypothetical protein
MIKKYDEFIVEAKTKTKVQYRENLKLSEEDKNEIIEYSNADNRIGIFLISSIS